MPIKKGFAVYYPEQKFLCGHCHKTEAEAKMCAPEPNATNESIEPAEIVEIQINIPDELESIIGDNVESILDEIMGNVTEEDFDE